MTGTDGQILKRPDSEEPIEHDGYFFAATLADVDPFIGQAGRADPTMTIAGWRAPVSDKWGCIYSLSDVLRWSLDNQSRQLGDDLILWPTDAEFRRRLLSKRKFRDVGPRDGR